MKIALAVFRDRLSPVFDWSNRLVVIETAGGEALSRAETDTAKMSSKARVDHLASAKVDTLICGGISRFLQNLVESRGIRVVPWIAGPVDEVITAFLEGRLSSKEFFMPGCCKRTQARQRAGRCRGKGPGNYGKEKP
jgi:predicted Fe-Mo cluster-binding NifX family protein